MAGKRQRRRLQGRAIMLMNRGGSPFRRSDRCNAKAHCTLRLLRLLFETVSNVIGHGVTTELGG